MIPLLIRKATPTDADSISEVILTAFMEFQSFYTDKAFAATCILPGEVIERIDEGPVWVAVHNKKVVGTVAAIKRKVDLYIRGMAVLPQARGLQIGWNLLEQIEKYAVENNYESLLLSTTPYLSSAIHLYEKFGFKKIGEIDSSFYGTLIFKMQKMLTLSTPSKAQSIAKKS